MSKKNIICLLFILFSVKGMAQGFSSFNGGSIGITSIIEPERKSKDSVGSYQYHSVGFNARIPLIAKLDKTTKHFYEISLNTDLQSGSAGFGFLGNSRALIQGTLGLGAIIYNGGKNILMTNAAIGLAADQFTIDNNNSRYRFSGSFIVNHLHSSTTIYQYGAALTYAYGRPLLLPIFGIRTKISSNWTLSAILPVELSFIDKLNAKTGLSFSLRPSGNRFQFDNKEYFNTSLSTLYLQLRDFQLGTAIYYKITKDFTVSGDVGFLVGGKLQFTQQDSPSTVLYKTTLNPGSVFRFSLRYRIPRKTEMRLNKMQDILNPLAN
ncbi:MAG: DUF6268 family outer membrane beta-barrel protein [Bacteroidetes bacterium]|nr:DUF6268 family outer membrane beta-barrel protein [Bacteroidota bacterium]